MKKNFVSLIAALSVVICLGVNEGAHAETSMKKDVISLENAVSTQGGNNPPVVLTGIDGGVNLDDSNTVLLPGTINDVADNMEKKYKQVVGENTLIGMVFNVDSNKTTGKDMKVHKIFYGETPDPAFAFVDRVTNRAYVPIRFIAEQLGAAVEWRSQRKATYWST